MKIKSVKLLKIDGLFSSYELTLDNDKVLYVPNDTDNSDYQEIQKWGCGRQYNRGVINGIHRTRN
jgi:hypothetical protein